MPKKPSGLTPRQKMELKKGKGKKRNNDCQRR